MPYSVCLHAQRFPHAFENDCRSAHSYLRFLLILWAILSFWRHIRPWRLSGVPARLHREISRGLVQASTLASGSTPCGLLRICSRRFGVVHRDFASAWSLGPVDLGPRSLLHALIDPCHVVGPGLQRSVVALLGKRTRPLAIAILIPNFLCGPSQWNIQHEPAHEAPLIHCVRG